MDKGSNFLGRLDSSELSLSLILFGRENQGFFFFFFFNSKKQGFFDFVEEMIVLVVGLHLL